MERINDIAYAPANGFRGLGYLFLPNSPEGAPAALVIHGGGWNAMDKKSLTPVANLMAECGFGAFNINYRLLNDAPWPACGNDCIAGAEFLLNAGHEAMGQLDRSRIVVIGASAGGHLALWTGLSLPQGKVRAIVDIAGPSDLVWRIRRTAPNPGMLTSFLGPNDHNEEGLAAASPVHLVKEGAPPLLCVHSVNDELVPIQHSAFMVEKYKGVGARAELFSFDGPGVAHGIWDDGSGEVDTDKRVLVDEVVGAVKAFLRAVCFKCGGMDI